MADDGGVLGNLPNARPGRRSAKRDAGAGTPAKAAGEAAKKAEKSGKAAARPARASRTSAKPGRQAAGAGTRPKQATARQATAPPPPPAPETSSDPVGAVVRTAVNVTLTGLRVTGALTQELLRRLPRP
jgi:hypothetical protein